MEQGVRLRVIGDPDVLRGEEEEKGVSPLKMLLLSVWVYGRFWCLKGFGASVWYHGFVDMSSSLELNDSVGISRGRLGVFEGTPSLCSLDLQLNQRGPLLFGPRKDGSVLSHQLTTTAPEQQHMMSLT